MAYDIDPFVGVGPIRLGMTRYDVRAAIGGVVQPVGHRGSYLPGDLFPDVGIFVDYREPGVSEFVEFGGPASPTLQGQAFLGQPYRVAREWFEARDPDIIRDDAGLRSLLFGVTLYAPLAEAEPDSPIESVGIFERGLFERRLEELAQKYSIARRRRARQ